EEQGRPDPLPDPLENGFVGGVGVAQIPLDELTQPAGVTDQEGVVQPQRLPPGGPVSLGQVGIDQEVDGVAGGQVDDGVVDQGNPQHHRDHDDQPADDVLAHAFCPLASRGWRGASPAPCRAVIPSRAPISAAATRTTSPRRRRCSRERRAAGPATLTAPTGQPLESRMAAPTARAPGSTSLSLMAKPSARTWARSLRSSAGSTTVRSVYRGGWGACSSTRACQSAGRAARMARGQAPACRGYRPPSRAVSRTGWGLS